MSEQPYSPTEYVIEGSVENIIYQNEENGYTVFSVNVLKTEDDEMEQTCTATAPRLSEGEHVKLYGDFVLHPSYGRQFNVTRLEYLQPTSGEGLVKYLGSGLIKGVGVRLAQKIVDEFGADTISVIESKPELLAEIKGINLNKALAIGNIFREQTDLRAALLYLQDLGISPGLAQKIYKRFGDKTIATVKQNPYSAADEVSGIGFKTADAIAYRMGIDTHSPFRIKSGIKYLLGNTAAAKGHVYLPKEQLVTAAIELMNVTDIEIETNLQEMQFEGSVRQEKLESCTAVYLNLYFYAESFTAKRLLELARNIVAKTDSLEKDIARIELQEGITLADCQKDAVREGMSEGVLVITGGPGTGKTTTINTLIKLLEEEDAAIVLAAPTGRAAKRMTEATGRDAMTIHRLLGMGFGEGDARICEKDEDDPIEADVVIIDESSMVDALLMYNLLRAIDFGTRLILVGDADQLPSVGAGNVLKDIIASGEIKTVCLTEIFRQAQESAIVMNAHRINHGEYPLLNEQNSDFFFVKRVNIENVINSIVELVTQRLPKFNGCDPADIQVLTPMRKSALGANNLNTILQQALNPAAPGKKEKQLRMRTFRVGDKVMQIKNNYHLTWRLYAEDKAIDEGSGVFNGDEGIIADINDDDEFIKVIFDENKVVYYDYSQLDELDLSYAVTIHKSQGSEYSIVVMPIHSGPQMLMSRNLLYTAVTRAKDLAVIVGIPDTLNRMVDNAQEVQRYSDLANRMTKTKAYFSN